MKFLDDEIVITPRVIYWTGLPGNITHDTIIDVLKNDILILPCDSRFSSFYRLIKAKQDRAAYFFNLDHIIEANAVKEENIQSQALALAKYIQTHIPARSMVYGNTLDQAVSGIFAKCGIDYCSSCFLDEATLVDSITHMTNSLFAGDNDKIGSEASRSSFRLLLLPLKYACELEKQGKTVTGYVKDISLNGIGCLCKDPNNAGIFQLEDRVDIRLFLKKKVIQITSCAVSRTNKADGEVGVTFEIRDSDAISEEDGDWLSGLLYTWLKQVTMEVSKLTG